MDTPIEPVPPTPYDRRIEHLLLRRDLAREAGDTSHEERFDRLLARSGYVEPEPAVDTGEIQPDE